MPIGIGVYRKADYAEILSISTDQAKLDETWEAWKKNKEKAQNNFKKMGISTTDVLVTPVELYRSCRENGLEINGEGRAKFVSWKLW